MSETLEAKVRRLAADSELLRAVASVREDGGLRYALGAAGKPWSHRSEPVSRVEIRIR